MQWLLCQANSYPVMIEKAPTPASCDTWVAVMVTRSERSSPRINGQPWRDCPLTHRPVVMDRRRFHMIKSEQRAPCPDRQVDLKPQRTFGR